MRNFLAIIFICFALLLPVQAFASTYGECNYGSSNYNSNNCPTPVPTPVTTTDSGNSGDSGSTNSNSAPAAPQGCSDAKPSSSPDLFQINTAKSGVTLFFSPIPSNRDRYYISYSTSANAELYGFEFMNSENGVVSVEVKALNPNTVYYFKVRAGNGCMPGDWSNIMAVRTGQKTSNYKWSALPKVIYTKIVKKIRPSAIKSEIIDSSRIAPAQNQTPVIAPLITPAVGPIQEPTATIPQTQKSNQAPQNTSVFGKVSNFFKSLFGG